MTRLSSLANLALPFLLACCAIPGDDPAPLGSDLEPTDEIGATVASGSIKDIDPSDPHAQEQGGPDAGPHEYSSPDGEVLVTLSFLEGQGWAFTITAERKSVSGFKRSKAGGRDWTPPGAEDSVLATESRPRPAFEIDTHRVGGWDVTIAPTEGDWGTARARGDFTVSFAPAPVHDPSSAGPALAAVLLDSLPTGRMATTTNKDPELDPIIFGSPDGVIALTFVRTTDQAWMVHGSAYRFGRPFDSYLKRISDRRALAETSEGLLTDDLNGYRFTILPTGGDWSAARTGDDFAVTFAAPTKAAAGED